MGVQTQEFNKSLNLHYGRMGVKKLQIHRLQVFCFFNIPIYSGLDKIIHTGHTKLYPTRHQGDGNFSLNIGMSLSFVLLFFFCAQ